MTLLEIGKIVRRRFGPFYPFPRRTAHKTMVKAIAPIVGFTRKYTELNVGYPLAFDNSRSRSELGLTYRPVEQTITEHFQQMIDDGLARRIPVSHWLRGALSRSAGSNCAGDIYDGDWQSYETSLSIFREPIYYAA